MAKTPNSTAQKLRSLKIRAKNIQARIDKDTERLAAVNAKIAELEAGE